MLPMFVVPQPLILYDPSATSIFGLTGLAEAQAVATNRGVPAGNILPLPTFAGEVGLGIRHSGKIIIITHGNAATNFRTATLRSNTRLTANATQMVNYLAGCGLFADATLAYRFELLICGAASGNDTFARDFYDRVRLQVGDVMVKAPVGLTSIAANGSISVKYWHPSTTSYSLGYAVARWIGSSVLSPARLVANLLPNLPSNPVSGSNILLHDWFFYPAGSSF